MIDALIYINLDRSPDRRESFESSVPKNLKVIRCPAIDGNDIEPIYKITKYEHACLLSHLKALEMLLETDGNLFMVCEDDVIFNNENDMEKIVNNCPPFDILKLHHLDIPFHSNPYFSDVYRRWNTEDKEWGAACYLITRQAIEKILNNPDKLYTVADDYIFKDVVTYTWIYMYVSLVDFETTIPTRGWKTNSSTFICKKCGHHN
jgi:hypothetical protein